jgi:GAF domain-containing protein
MSDERSGEPDGWGLHSNHTGAFADRLAQRLCEFAEAIDASEGLEDTVRQIVHAAVGTVPGAQHASICRVRRRGDGETLAATAELARAVDSAQYNCGQGPCLETLYDEKAVRLSDLATEQRWPAFTGRARKLGVRSMLAVRLSVQSDGLWALSLHSKQPYAFDAYAQHVASLFATHAAVAMSNEQSKEDLRTAVSTREVIGKAQGILMERFKITDDLAFRLLVRASQDTNRKLRDIAEELAATGQLAGA